MPCDAKTGSRAYVANTSSAFFPRANLEALSVEHDDLDAAISVLLRDRWHDELLVTRLKKRKLRIKDALAGASVAGAPSTVVPACGGLISS